MHCPFETASSRASRVLQMLIGSVGASGAAPDLPANGHHTVPNVDTTRCQSTRHKEKLHFHAHIWYKVSRSERVSYNGITPASQADNEGSYSALAPGA